MDKQPQPAAGQRATAFTAEEWSARLQNVKLDARYAAWRADDGWMDGWRG